MRLTILVIGIGIAVVFWQQASDAHRVASLGAAFGVEEAQAMKIVASGGLNAALFGFVSAAFVFVSGFVAAVGFTLAGLIAFSIRADFGDAVIWGGVFYALAVLSVVDAVRRRRAKRAQRARRAPASHQA